MAKLVRYTCKNCKNYISILEDASHSGYHIHDWCSFWRSPIPDGFALYKYGLDMIDVEAGIACCYGFDMVDYDKVETCFPELPKAVLNYE